MSVDQLNSMLDTQFSVLEQRVKQAFNVISGQTPVAIGPVGPQGPTGPLGISIRDKFRTIAGGGPNGTYDPSAANVPATTVDFATGYNYTIGQPVKDSQGNVFFSASFTLSSTDYAFILKIDTDGILSIYMNFSVSGGGGTLNFTSITSLAISPSGDLVFTGVSQQGGGTHRLCRLTAAGAVLGQVILYSVTNPTFIGLTSTTYVNTWVDSSDSIYLIVNHTYSGNGDITSGTGPAIYKILTGVYTFTYVSTPTSPPFIWPYNAGGTPKYTATSIVTDSYGFVYVGSDSDATILKYNSDGSIYNYPNNLYTLYFYAGSIKGYSGDGGPAANAKFQTIQMTIDSDNNIYVADTVNQVVRKINATGANTVNTIVGNTASGTYVATEISGLAARLNPDRIFSDSNGVLYISDSANHRVYTYGDAVVPSGKTGPQGTTGATGAAGSQGTTGPTGAPGPSGPPGIDGNTITNLISGAGTPVFNSKTSFTINDRGDKVVSQESLTLAGIGIFLRTTLPAISVAASEIRVGMRNSQNRFIYAALVAAGTSPDFTSRITIWDNSTPVRTSQQYNNGDVFTIYCDGYNINYIINDTVLVSEPFTDTTNWTFFAEVLAVSHYPGLTFNNVLFSPIGLKGSDGPSGSIGATGPLGPTGPSGGPVGPTGPAGPSGATGPNGAIGPSGATGPAGSPGGATGPTGPQPFSLQGAWQSQGYRVGDAVTYNGSLYICTQNTSDEGPVKTPDTSSRWQLYVSAGDPGSKGNTGDTGPDGATGPAGVDQFIVVGSGIPSGTLNPDGEVKLAYSYDGGKTLIPVSDCPIDVCVTSVAYNGSYWIAGGQGQYGIAKSTDGISWTGMTSPFGQGTASGTRTNTSICNSIAWGETKWMAVGRKYVAESGIIHVLAATSTDGEDWTETFTSDDIFGGGAGVQAILNTVAWNGTSWLVGGTNQNDGAPKHVAVSTNEDGSSWTSTVLFPGGSATSITWNGSVWLVGGYIPAGSNNDGNKKGLYYSSDGISFYPILNSAISSTNQIWSTAWNGSIWVGLGQAGQEGSIIYSIDGLIWTVSNDNIFINSAGYSVVWNGSIWIAVGSRREDAASSIHEPVIATSDNGVNWTIIPQAVFTARLNAVATKRVLPYEGITHSVMRFGSVNPYIDGVPNQEMSSIGLMFPGDLYMDISGRNLYKYYAKYGNIPFVGGLGGSGDTIPIMNFGPIIQYGSATTSDSTAGGAIVGVSTIRFAPNSLGDNVFSSPPNITVTIVADSATVSPGFIAISDVTSTCFSTFTYNFDTQQLCDYRFNWQAML
jgi:uncharacterized protein (UPF0297 family)